MAKRKLPPRGPQLKLAGALCVAFVNTAGARPNNSQQGVDSYAELLTWAQQADVASALEAERLRRLAAERPQDAEAAYAKTAELRRVLLRIFDATAREKAVPQGDLDALNATLAEALAALRLVPGEPGLAWGWTGDEDALDRVLWPVARSAAETLIAAAGRPQVRKCAFKDCPLYFVDVSPTRQRRWCQMATCGNRAKSLQYYYRTGRAERDKHMRYTYQWTKRRPRKKTPS